MALSREQIIARASHELAQVRSAACSGELAQAALARAGHESASGPVDVCLVDVTRMGGAGHSDGTGAGSARRVVGVTLAFDACTADVPVGVVLDRLIGPFGVVDVHPEGLVVVEVALGVSARDLQERSTVPIWAGPALGPVASSAGGLGAS